MVGNILGTLTDEDPAVYHDDPIYPKILKIEKQDKIE